MTPDLEVDHYLASAPRGCQPALEALREACLQFLPGFHEIYRYGMPSYERDNEVEIAFACQQQHISFYVLRTDVLNAHRSRLEERSLGKGCIRYRSPAQIEMDVVHSILKMNALTSGEIC